MDQTDAYQQTLDYLYTYVDFSMTRGTRYSADQFDLGRMAALVAELGHPEGDYPSIHIAGTKGKGSVAALCKSALMSAGLRTGLYISPHLHDYAERIQIDGVPIPHDELVALVEDLKPVLAKVPQITTFEITTALGFLYFARHKVDVAVLEVGLGGRLDATNVVTPQVSVITSISYDHTALLGNTISQIAQEKAGIIKAGVPVVVSPQQEDAIQAIERIATERAAPLYRIGVDFRYESKSYSLDGQDLLVWYEGSDGKLSLDGQPLRLTIPLLGDHQVQNAATAYAALRIFGNTTIPILNKHIQDGFARAQWPGRFEILRREPPVVVDCAHNRDSTLKLRLALDKYFPDWPVVLVYGASEDKDISGMFAELAPRVQQVIATKSFHPRAIEAERLAEIAQQYSLPVTIVPDVPEALDEALSRAGSDQLVLVTGSIFIAAGAREAWMARNPGQVTV